MREATLSIREWGQPGPESVRIGAFYRRHQALLILSLAGAPFLAGVGAFDTGMFPALIIYPYFLILMLAGGHIAMLTLDGMAARGIFRRSAVGRAAMVIAALGLFQTPLVYLAAGLALGGSWEIGRNLTLLPQVMLVAAGFASLQLLDPREKRVDPVATAEELPRSPSLPVGLDGPLCAIQAEDHYLRLHTPTGSTLVLMRFRDALAALDHLDGAQVHRSWWVARDAIRHVARGKGRATVTLENGVTVPVSRTFAPSLRQWAGGR